MGHLRAVFVEHIVAVGVNSLDVVPPDVMRPCVVVLNLVKALLSEILKNDFSSFDVHVTCLYSTVFASSVAVIFQVWGLAEWTFPKYVMRSHQHLVSKLFIKAAEVCDKVKSSVIWRGEPDVVLYSVIRLVHNERSHNSHRLPVFRSRFFIKLYQFIAISLADQHWRDSNATACAIICHDFIFQIFIVFVHYDAYSCSDVLNVSHFSNERTLTPPS